MRIASAVEKARPTPTRWASSSPRRPVGSGGVSTTGRAFSRPCSTSGETGLSREPSLYVFFEWKQRGETHAEAQRNGLLRLSRTIRRGGDTAMVVVGHLDGHDLRTMYRLEVFIDGEKRAGIRTGLQPLRELLHEVTGCPGPLPPLEPQQTRLV